MTSLGLDAQAWGTVILAIALAFEGYQRRRDARLRVETVAVYPNRINDLWPVVQQIQSGVTSIRQVTSEVLAIHEKRSGSIDQHIEILERLAEIRTELEIMNRTGRGG